MQRNPIAAGLLVIGAFSAAASAVPQTIFTNAPVTNGGSAITDDGNLANRVQNLMSVTIAPGLDWTNSKIRIQLTQGTIYNATNAVGTESNPNAAFWTTTGFRNGPFDTFVNSKGTGATPDSNPQSANLLGSVNPDGSDGPLPAAGLSSNDATLVAAAWGDTVAGESGTFSVARFTLSTNASGTFFGQSFDSTSGGIGTPFSGTIVNGALVPEPATLGLAVLGLLGLAARRRCRSMGRL